MSEMPPTSKRAASVGRENRRTLLSVATIFKDDVEITGVRVRNLSPRGLAAIAKAPMKKGEKVTIRLKGIGEVSGRVAWSDGERFGIALESEIDLEKLERGSLAAVPLANDLVVPRSFEPTTESIRLSKRDWNDLTIR